MDYKVKCNKCGYTGKRNEFPKRQDFFQREYIAGCANPDCNNSQNPGDASIRMFGGERPFSFVRTEIPDDAPSIVKVLGSAQDAS
ncbi:hypothetical protein LCGC14_2926250 [marine sediment metagenome]|uniref:Uncharacterized protein n=1 Tax=marine sediment metagenome TaxID=412755 RepID=A0A0F8Y926_9ZZZZ